MVDRLKVINFLQDFGCAKLEHLQIYITFLSKDNLMYHIIVATEEKRNGIVKIINSYPVSLPKVDKLIVAFPDIGDLQNINCSIPFLYTSYPKLEVLNKKNNMKE